jgi:tRNA (mo5U34)-methyltransferase
VDALTLTREELGRRVSEIEWYHTIELAPGLLTPGSFDTRGRGRQTPDPTVASGSSLSRHRNLRRFWAYEMERRGAKEVIAIDLLDPQRFDWPANSTPDAKEAIGQRKDRGEGFEIARGALDSSVTRIERSVYELGGDVGTFDFVYLGSLLLHLRDPVGALMRVRHVRRGEMLVVDAVRLMLSRLRPRRPVATLDGRGRPWWWKPNIAGLVRMVEAAGFEPVGTPRVIWMPLGDAQSPVPIRLATLRTGPGHEALLARRKGDPHAAVLARPI